MVKIVYEVLEHDGGWAYRVNGAFSESFPSHSDAVQAAHIAAKAQQKRDESDFAALETGQSLHLERMNLEVMDTSRSRHRFSLSDRA